MARSPSNMKDSFSHSMLLSAETPHPEPTVRQLAEAERRRAVQLAKSERRKMVQETTMEDIADFEHKLGLRNRKPGVRYHDRQKQAQEEAMQMGVKLVNVPRCMSPLRFYDYEVAQGPTIPAKAPSSTKATSRFLSSRGERAAFTATSPLQDDYSPRDLEDPGFDPPPGFWLPAGSRPYSASTYNWEDKEELQDELRKIGGAPFEYETVKNIKVETKRSQSAPLGMVRPRHKERPKTVWSNCTMLEPIFMPEMTALPSERVELKVERKPMMPVGNTLHWDSSYGTLAIDPPVGPPFSAMRKGASWESTVGRRYYAKRLEEYALYQRRLANEKTRNGLAHKEVHQRMRQRALDVHRTKHMRSAQEARQRGEYYPKLMQKIERDEARKREEVEELAEIRERTLGLSMAQLAEEERELHDELNQFEARLQKLSPAQRASARAPLKLRPGS
eukprot:CAMPEP_0114555836 /NCGR_PEP_ID=MMETSP0114-20121206/8963_1 /TAXON_ID=31324 /ORGANISM="Goniomonas sp, Strain m" /LENGTH=446 /DNA_ID=CAMNT_0001740991 /DNA_START=40 /DNA_END=1380 /DNA_ORIENTATION=+